MPQVKTQEALLFLLYAVLSGVFLGVVYDAERTLRSLFKSRFSGIVIDVLYFLFAGVFFFLFCLALDFGRLRGFFVFGFITGFLIYRKTVSKFIYKFFKLLVSVSGKILSVFFLPVKKVIKLSFSFINHKIFSKIYKNVIKKLLKKCKGLLYNKKYNKGKVGKISVGKEENSQAEIERYFS